MFSPASRPTSTNVAPTEALGWSEASAAESVWIGRASAITSPSGSTSALRLRDFKNARREVDKRGNTFPSLDRVRMRRYFYSERLPGFASLGHGPDRCKSTNYFVTVRSTWPASWSQY